MQKDLIDTIKADTVPICYDVRFKVITGSTNAALLLSQMLYWQGRRPDGWLWNTREQWTQQTGLSRKEQEVARRILRDKGFIEEKHGWRRADGSLKHRIDYKVDAKAVLDAISVLKSRRRSGKTKSAAEEPQTGRSNGSKSDPSNGTEWAFSKTSAETSPETPLNTKARSALENTEAPLRVRDQTIPSEREIKANIRSEADNRDASHSAGLHGEGQKENPPSEQKAATESRAPLSQYYGEGRCVECYENSGFVWVNGGKAMARCPKCGAAAKERKLAKARELASHEQATSVVADFERFFFQSMGDPWLGRKTSPPLLQAGFAENMKPSQVAAGDGNRTRRMCGVCRNHPGFIVRDGAIVQCSYCSLATSRISPSDLSTRKVLAMGQEDYTSEGVADPVVFGTIRQHAIQLSRCKPNEPRKLNAMIRQLWLGTDHNLQEVIGLLHQCHYVISDDENVVMDPSRLLALAIKACNNGGLPGIDLDATSVFCPEDVFPESNQQS
jgi:hypothetical protein